MAELIHPRIAQVISLDQDILSSFAMTVHTALDGVCIIDCVVPQQLVNAAGFAHGSLAFALLDTACAYALGSLEVQGVTINANTTYVRGAQAGSELRGRVEVVSRGRRVATLTGEVTMATADGPKLSAHGSFVFQLMAP